MKPINGVFGELSTAQLFCVETALQNDYNNIDNDYNMFADR